MEMAHLNSATLASDMIASSSPAAANAPPVYNSTTIPLNGNSRAESQQSPSKDEKFELRTFNNLPERKPVDIQFKDISYCVKAGFRKGEFLLQRLGAEDVVD